MTYKITFVSGRTRDVTCDRYHLNQGNIVFERYGGTVLVAPQTSIETMEPFDAPSQRVAGW